MKDKKQPAPADKKAPVSPTVKPMDKRPAPAKPTTPPAKISPKPKA